MDPSNIRFKAYGSVWPKLLGTVFLGLLFFTSHSPTASAADCTPPASGDWTVTSSCTINGTVIASGSVTVNPAITVTVSPGAKLLIDFKHFKLLVKKTGGVLVKKTGVVRQVKPTDVPSDVYTLSGIDFSPYMNGQSPNTGINISEAQIRSRLAIIAPHTKWIRTFSSTHGLEETCRIAKEFNLKCAMGAWISRDTAANTTEINNLVTAAKAGYVDLAIVGSEALLRNDVSDTQLVNYMQTVKSQIPNIPVSAADTYDQLLTYPSVVAASDVVMANYYPYWQYQPIDLAMGFLNSWHQQLVAKAGGKPVWVSEAGWPSAGSPRGQAVPSPENASFYFLNFVSWAKANNVQYFYFEGLDEAWKTGEGPEGPHWGIWDALGNLKSGMKQVFDGQTMADNWSWNGLPGGPGTPTVTLTYVPPYGSFNRLEGQVLHASPGANKIVLFIYAAGAWYIKPLASSPQTIILPDGTWSSSITTGGIDQYATKITAFLYPNSYIPGSWSYYSLPSELFQNALAYVQIDRTQSSISGKITNPSNQAISGVIVGLTEQPSLFAITNSAGNYSFYNIPASGGYTVVPTKPGFVFTPTQQSVYATSTNVQANFIGTNQ